MTEQPIVYRALVAVVSGQEHAHDVKFAPTVNSEDNLVVTDVDGVTIWYNMRHVVRWQMVEVAVSHNPTFDSNLLVAGDIVRVRLFRKDLTAILHPEGDWVQGRVVEADNDELIVEVSFSDQPKSV